MTRFSLVVLLTMLVSVSADVRDWTVNQNVTRGVSISYTLNVAYLISVNSAKLYVNYANSTNCTKNFNLQGSLMQRSCSGKSCTFYSDTLSTSQQLLTFTNAGTCVANVKTGSVTYSTYSTYDFPENHVNLAAGDNYFYDYPSSLLVDSIYEFAVTLQSSCAVNPVIQMVGSSSVVSRGCSSQSCTVTFNSNDISGINLNIDNRNINIRNIGGCLVTLTNPSMVYSVDISKVLAALAAWAIAMIIIGALCCAFCVVLGVCFRRRRTTTSAVIVSSPQYPIVQAAQPTYDGQAQYAQQQQQYAQPQYAQQYDQKAAY